MTGWRGMLNVYMHALKVENSTEQPEYIITRMWVWMVLIYTLRKRSREATCRLHLRFRQGYLFCSRFLRGCRRRVIRGSYSERGPQNHEASRPTMMPCSARAQYRQSHVGAGTAHARCNFQSTMVGRHVSYVRVQCSY